MMLLPSAPSDRVQGAAAIAPITPPSHRWLEPVGWAFLGHARRRSNGRTLSEDDRIQAELSLNDQQLDQKSCEEEEEEEDSLMLMRDPKDWRSQDHYAILGLSKLRFAATPVQIRTTYRRKVLKHHPDKKASHDDGFFKCIQKAWDVLSDPVRRRQFDAVDTGIPDTLPGLKEGRGVNFFNVYLPVFERESRFSVKTPVPTLGDESSSRAQVEAFYNFWNHFESWRSFEYLDKVEDETAENREHKRWLEKKNTSERARRKKEDNARIIRLVEQASKCDPRLTAFKEEERLAKEARKATREEQLRKQVELEQLREQEVVAEKKRLELEERDKAIQEKRLREARRREARKERKIIKTIVKDVILDEGILAGGLDMLLETIELERLTQLKERLSILADNSNAMRTELLAERKVAIESGLLQQAGTQHILPEISSLASKKHSESSGIASAKAHTAERPWSPDELSVFIKAVNKFPGGTRRRWETISEYISQHTRCPPRSGEELIKKSHCVRQGTMAAQDTTIKKLQEKRPTAGEIKIQDAPSVRYAEPQDSTAAAKEMSEKPSNNVHWSAEEQQHLERALKAYPPSWTGSADRWDKIAEAVEGKSKRECKLRVKFLAEQVKAKKAAAGSN